MANASAIIMVASYHLAAQQEPYHGKCLNMFWEKGQEMDHYQENEKTVQEV